MTAIRLIPLSLHGALEMLGGLLLMLAPFALGFSDAALVTAVVIGAVVTGIALLTSAEDRPGMPISSHIAFDQFVVLVLGLAAATVALRGDVVAGAVFALAAIVQVVLASITRYTR